MRLILLAFFVLHGFSAIGQDLLIKRDGDTVKAVVIFVYQDYLKYRKYGNTTSPIVSIPKYDLSKAIYASGNVEDFMKFEKPVTNDTVATTIGLDSSQIYYSLGTKDAFRYYKGYKSYTTTVYITSVLLFPLGLTIAAISSTDAPVIAKTEIPNEKLWLNQSYKNGYLTSAKARKSHRVWSNFFYGFGTAFVVGLVITSTQK